MWCFSMLSPRAGEWTYASQKPKWPSKDTELKKKKKKNHTNFTGYCMFCVSDLSDLVDSNICTRFQIQNVKLQVKDTVQHLEYRKYKKLNIKMVNLNG